MLFFWFPESFTVHLRKFCSIMPGFLPSQNDHRTKKMVLPYKWQTWSNGIANNTFVKVFKSSSLRKYHLRAKFSFILKRHICFHLYLLFARYSRNFSRKSFKFQRCCYYHKSFFLIHAVICVCCCLFINAMLWSTRCVALSYFGISLVWFVETCHITGENSKYMSNHSYCNLSHLFRFSLLHR